MDDVQVPQLFLCPISLQIMRDPVTAITGITYERESIEKWLQTARESPTCPVTKQPLPIDSYLTPNHTLRRLIQSWCTANARNGVDPIPTPKSPVDKSQIRKLLRQLDVPQLCANVLKKMEAMATENERNRTSMAEAGTGKAMVSFIVKCFKQRQASGLQEALFILDLVWSSPSEEIKILVKENYDFVDSLTWVLVSEMDNQAVVKTHAMQVLKKTIEIISPSLLQGLKPDFLKAILKILREKISQQAVKSALLVLIDVCPWGRNRTKIIEANAVFELIELELEKPEKNITELILDVLSHLCCCADGREQFLKHAGSIAMLSKRILRVSPATDDRALHILSLISKFSATDEVLQEMLRVGAVSKLCMVIQADCASYLKDQARGILRMHNNVWNNSPCIAVYLLTRYPR